MNKWIKIAFRNILKNKRRSLVTVLAIAVGFAAVGLFKGYMADLARSKFVLSPRGAGMDCHRTWEALLVGSIPIVPSTKINDLYENLPILIIEDWSVINEDFLNEKWEEMHQVEYDYERMFAQYWLDKIKQYQVQVRTEFQRGQ